jgi:two-component system chemotaxis response regulator CheB
MKKMHDNSGATIAQGETFCFVLGMPKEAIARGGIDHIVPLERISSLTLKLAQRA